MTFYICQNCGKEFKDKPSAKRIYCSKKCWYASKEFEKWTKNPSYSEAKAKNARRVGFANKGKPGWNKGIACPEWLKGRISRANKGRLVNKKNPNWKGDNVGICALHSWVKRRLKKPKECKFCKKEKKLELSNISGKYKRDLSDFQWLCVSCHARYDKKFLGRQRDEKGRFI